MKKFLTTILATILVLQLGICAVAAPTTILNPEYNVETPITLMVKGPYDASYVAETTVGAGEAVSVKSTINMEPVRTQFATLLALGRTETGSATAGRNVPITGSFTVTLEYPTAVVLPASITKGVDEGGENMAGFSANAKNAFVETGRTLITSGLTNTLTIAFDVKPGITGADLEDNLNSYLGDMYIEAFGATVAADGAPHFLYGHIEGSVVTTYTQGSYTVNTTVNFENATDPQAKINVLVSPGPGPSPAGPAGNLKYNVVFNTNGGNKLETLSYNDGTTITPKILPVPTREGYAFAGWFTDEALTAPLTSIKLISSVTLYAAWTAVEIPGDYVPEMLESEDHYAYIIGYPDGTVQPDGTITRAEVATIFFRLLKEDIRNENLTYVNDFSDVNEGQWYNGAISTLTAMGILRGKDGGVFEPNAKITRGEFAAIVARFSEQEKEIAEDFVDVDGHWAEGDIYEAAAHGWIKGYEDDTFRPDAKITRAETMTLINRVLIRLPKSASALLDDMAKWSDNMNENAWFYLAVQEATNSHDYVRDEAGYETWTKMEENRDWSTYEKK